jgi:Methyltransferase small domain
VSASTMALAGATIRRPIAAALDLGTGCGVQALYASAHADRVVATDLNPRAAALCRLTMALNDASTVEVREGDMLAPVAGETFDLIVANPPFVISPARRYLFRDAGAPIDELCRDLVRAAPAQLAPGGHAQFLASWAHLAGEDWRDRLAGWCAGTGGDALVLAREVLEPGAHAAGWLRQTEPPEAWQAQYDEWMDYYERHGIEAVGLGLISLRRRDGGEGWFRVEDAPQDFVMPCGDHLGAAFELADFVAAHAGDRLLEVTLAVAPDVVLDERARPAGGDGWAVSDRRLRQTAGLCREGALDGPTAALVAACDGTRPLGTVIGDAASVSGSDPAGLARAALPVVARLVEQGFLLPAAG